MFRKKPEAGNQRSDDDLISVYVDGRMGPEERAAFEARLQAEPALRRQVEATRLLVGAARQLPAVRPSAQFRRPVHRPRGAHRRPGPVAPAAGIGIRRAGVRRRRGARPGPVVRAADAVCEPGAAGQFRAGRADRGNGAGKAGGSAERGGARTGAASRAERRRQKQRSAPKAEAPMAAESAPALAGSCQVSRGCADRSAGGESKPPPHLLRPPRSPKARPGAPAKAWRRLAQRHARPAATAGLTSTSTSTSTSTPTSTSTSEDMPASALVAARCRGPGCCKTPVWLALVAVLALLAAVILGVLGWRKA